MLIPAAFGIHVGHILTLRAQEQVIRANARRIIATVTDTQSLWDRAVMKFPGEAMRPDVFACIVFKAPISILIKMAYPNPAIPRFVHFGPKSVCGGNTVIDMACVGVTGTAAKAKTGRVTSLPGKALAATRTYQFYTRPGALDVATSTAINNPLGMGRSSREYLPAVRAFHLDAGTIFLALQAAKPCSMNSGRLDWEYSTACLTNNLSTDRRFGMLRLHDENSFRCATPLAVSAARGHFISSIIPCSEAKLNGR
jgi:hypothetical protein